jgi:hypothetical protein
MVLMVSRAQGILPVPEVGNRKMAIEYRLAFSARPAKIRLRLATEQSSRSLYGNFTQLMYFAMLVELEGSMFPE